MLSIGTPNEKLYKRLPFKNGKINDDDDNNKSSLLLQKQNSIITTTTTTTKKLISLIDYNNNNNKNNKNDDKIENLIKNFFINKNFILENWNNKHQHQQFLLNQHHHHHHDYHHHHVSPKPLVIAGPSGSGKSTLIKLLMKEFQDYFGFSISHTTRKPRNGEQNGREYYFIDHETFEENIQNDEFIEYTRFSNNFYGTSKKSVKDVQNAKKICILDVEIDGVRNLKKTDLNARFVFVKPPSLDVLEQRLRLRGTENEQSLQQRLQRAIDELKFGEIDGMFDLIITNDNIDHSYNLLREFILNEVEALKKSRGM